MLDDGGNKSTIADNTLVLLRNSQLDDLTLGRNENVNGIGLGGNKLGFEACLAQVERDTRALVHSKAGHLSLGLNLNSTAVDNLNGGNGGIENNTSLLAVVNGDGVDLSRDVDNTVISLVDVHDVLGLRISNLELLVVIKVFLRKEK